MTEPTCPRNEQAIGWMLHSLEPEDEMAVAGHFPECPSCRRAAAEAGEVLAHLGAAVEQVNPPPALRDRLMAQVAATPQQRSPAWLDARPAPSLPVPTRTGAEPVHRQLGGGRTRPSDNRPSGRAGRPRRARRVVAAALAVVAVLAIGGLAARNYQLQTERDTQLARNYQLQTERDTQLAQTRSLENLLDQFGRPGVRHALLAREDGSTVAAVVVANGQPQVFPIAMQPNATDRDTYVLWGVADGANPAPLGAFDVKGEASGLLAVGGPEPKAYSAYAISLEPGRTAPTVPTDVVASGPVVA